VYRTIVAVVREIAPFFDDFVLKPQPLNPQYILLKWRSRQRDYEFGPHQLSDGLLRFIALTTVLQQPIQTLPRVLVIDEPELGLHPAALHLLARMIESASRHTQLVVATQSAALVDEFLPEDVLVVNQHEGASQFERLREERLKDWLQEYTLGQLWEKNVVGGGPSA
jgi:predicted ATPase